MEILELEARRNVGQYAVLRQLADEDIVYARSNTGTKVVNRLVWSKSPHRRPGSAPRCRPVASWGWRSFQGFGCSPIKAARELGSERRETVDFAVYKFGPIPSWKTVLVCGRR